jgi:hypothetical protein
MSWTIALVGVIAIPIWIVVHWIPRCDEIGIYKSLDRRSLEERAKQSIKPELARSSILA